MEKLKTNNTNKPVIPVFFLIRKTSFSLSPFVVFVCLFVFQSVPKEGVVQVKSGSLPETAISWLKPTLGQNSLAYTS